MATRIALAQLDARLGDLAENERRARAALQEAEALGAELVVFPELQLTGYALGQVEHDTATSPDGLPALAGGASALFGFHERNGSATYNSAAYVEGGRVVHVHRKLYLPHYLDFEEGTTFAPGDRLRAFDTAAGRVATLICNDAWQPMLPVIAVHDGAQILLVPSASSTAVPEAERYWRDLTRFYAQMLECWVVFVNRVGEEPGFTFWGGSHVVDPRGEVVAEAPRFEEALLVVDVDLEQVDARRRELPLVGDPRLDLLAAELERLAR
jgi:predicted amidohydrolase